MDSDNKECSTCKFWEPFVDGKGVFIYGECHRFPPTPQRVPIVGSDKSFPNIYDLVHTRPRTEHNESCGEHIHSNEK